MSKPIFKVECTYIPGNKKDAKARLTIGREIYNLRTWDTKKTGKNVILDSEWDTRRFWDEDMAVEYLAGLHPEVNVKHLKDVISHMFDTARYFGEFNWE